MCGIAGIFDARGEAEIPPARLKAMTDAIARRGPDGEGAWFAPGLALGHRRLAIIDPAGGAQPMLSEDGRLAVVFNGMIYNFRELRADLEAQGAQFRTHCDTEVLLHGWRVWGEALPEKLDGFFAVGLWDAEAETLVLMRDLWGKKPLYLAETGGKLLFGSDADALLAGLDQAPGLREEALAEYLAYGYVPDSTALHAGLEKLPPASLLIWRRGRPRPKSRRWGRIRIHPEDQGRSLKEAAEELDALLGAAVRKRLVADAPLGVLLSGGLDSGAALAMASRARGTPLTACTMGFADPDLDETEAAALMARRWGAEHLVEQADPEAMADPEGLAAIFGEPFADPSAAPTLAVCRLAARRMKAALSGDGGDEVFAGYRRYPFHLREERAKSLLPLSLRGPLFGGLARIWPRGEALPRPLRAGATLEALAGDQAAGLLRATAIMDEPTRRALLSPALRARLKDHDPADLLRKALAEAETDDPLARAQYADLTTWLPGRMLVKLDRTSMAVGLEARNPLLDKDLALWAARLPTRLKLDGFSGKRVLRAALEPYAPPEILKAPKRGFVPPLKAWLMGPLRGRVEAMARSEALGPWLDLAALGRLSRETFEERRDHSRALWACLMLEARLARLPGK